MEKVGTLLTKIIFYWLFALGIFFGTLLLVFSTAVAVQIVYAIVEAI